MRKEGGRESGEGERREGVGEGGRKEGGRGGTNKE